MHVSVHMHAQKGCIYKGIYFVQEHITPHLIAYVVKFKCTYNLKVSSQVGLRVDLCVLVFLFDLPDGSGMSLIFT